MIASHHSVETAISAAIAHAAEGTPPVQLSPEQLALAAGQLVCYADMLGRLINGHQVLAIERELAMALSPTVTFMCKPDLIVGGQGRAGVYRETKTTSNNSPAWLRSWDYAVQVHTGMWVAQQLHPEWQVESCQIVGLYKGYMRDGRIQSPLVWAYRSPSTGGLLPNQYRPKYVKGWEKVGTWTYPGGTLAYVREQILPNDEVRGEQVFTTRPISLNEDLVQAFIRQLCYTEERMGEALAISTTQPDERVFPQRFSECQTRWGTCPYLECCWSPEVREDPLGSGQYVVRTPHHETEAEAGEDA